MTAYLIPQFQVTPGNTHKAIRQPAHFPPAKHEQLHQAHTPGSRLQLVERCCLPRKHLIEHGQLVLHISDAALLRSNALQLLKHVPRHAALGIATAHQEFGYAGVCLSHTRQQRVQVVVVHGVNCCTGVVNCGSAEAGTTC
jgi:hypothetical protein